MQQHRTILADAHNVTNDRGVLLVADAETTTLVLDCTGMQCPLPVIKTAQAIKTLEVGAQLELLATDPGVDPDMRAWSRRTGNELVSIDQQGDVFHVLIRRAR